MVFTREPPRAVEVMTAAAAAPSPSSTSPPSHRTPPPAHLRGKPRSRNPMPAINAWVSQRLAHCVDAAAAAAHDPQAPPAPPTSAAPASVARHRSSPGSRDDGFERIRAKLMDHLREAADRIELPQATFAAASGIESYRKGENAAETTAKAHVDDGGSPHAAFSTVNPVTKPSVTPAPLSSADDLPWNLRTRRSILASGARQQHLVPDASAAAAAPKPATRLRSGAPERRESAMRRRRARFSVSLTKEEIDEDVYAFTGRLAARRPKRRPRAVQRQLDMLFPGLYLSEVTLDMYQVADPPLPPPS